MRIAAFSLFLLLSAAPAAQSASISFAIANGVGGVTVSGSGSIDTTGLGQRSTVTTAPIVNGALPALVVGPIGGILADRYLNVFVAPIAAFGTGFDFANSGSGDRFGLSVAPGLTSLLLPLNYVSGAALAGQSFFAGSTVQSLGLTTGTTTYTLLDDQTIDVVVSGQPSPVPLPAAALLLASGLGALTIAGRRRA